MNEGIQMSTVSKLIEQKFSKPFDIFVNAQVYITMRSEGWNNQS